MSDAFITAGFSFLGSVIVALIALWGIKIQSKKQDSKFDTFQTDVREDIKTEMQIQQAITSNELKHLTEEVRKHNNFAVKIPAIEKDIDNIKEDIEGIKNKLNQV